MCDGLDTGRVNDRGSHGCALEGVCVICLWDVKNIVSAVSSEAIVINTSVGE